MEEIWKDIPEYEGIYQISNLGRVRSLDRYVMHGKGNAKRFVKGKIIKLQIDSKGYYQPMYHFEVLNHNQSASILIPAIP